MSTGWLGILATLIGSTGAVVSQYAPPPLTGYVATSSFIVMAVGVGLVCRHILRAVKDEGRG